MKVLEGVYIRGGRHRLRYVQYREGWAQSGREHQPEIFFSKITFLCLGGDYNRGGALTG